VVAEGGSMNSAKIRIADHPRTEEKLGDKGQGAKGLLLGPNKEKEHYLGKRTARQFGDVAEDCSRPSGT